MRASQTGVRDQAAGDIIDDRFRLEGPLGLGGFGVVWRARQLGTDRPVAIKMMKPDLAAPDLLERFRREAKAASQLSDPNAITIYAYGEHGGAPYIAMELLEGESLKERLKRGPLSPWRAAHIAIQALHALEEAHRIGIVHRDIKPDNIFLTTRRGEQDFVKVLDFGIARVATDTGLTLEGTALGTPKYMSPEQGRGKPFDGRADLYALGIVLFEMLAGCVPFAAESPYAVVYMHIHEEPPPFEEVCAHAVPSALAAIVYKALEKAPAARWPSAHAMREALKTILPQLPDEGIEPLLVTVVEKRGTLVTVVEKRSGDDPTPVSGVAQQGDGDTPMLPSVALEPPTEHDASLPIAALTRELTDDLMPLPEWSMEAFDDSSGWSSQTPTSIPPAVLVAPPPLPSPDATPDAPLPLSEPDSPRPPRRHRVAMAPMTRPAITLPVSPDEAAPDDPAPDAVEEEPTPRRSSSTGLVLGGALVAVLLVVGLGLWLARTALPSAEPSPPQPAPEGEAPGAGAADEPAASALVRLDTRPVSAEVWRGGQRLGQTPLPLTQEQLGVEPVTVELRAEGWGPAEARIDWSPDQAAAGVVVDLASAPPAEPTPPTAEGLVASAHDKLDQGDAEGAVSDASAALKLGAGGPAHVVLAQAREAQGRPAEAVKHYNLSLKGAPCNTAAARKVVDRIVALGGRPACPVAGAAPASRPGTAPGRVIFDPGITPRDR